MSTKDKPSDARRADADLLPAQASGAAIAAPAAGARRPAAARRVALGAQRRSRQVEAALDGKVDEVRALVAQGTVTNWRGRGGRTPLQAAVMYEDNSAILEALLGAGADVNDVDDQGFTALMIAALKGRVESAKFLLAHGAVAGFKAAAGYYRGRTAAQLAADGKKDMDGVIKRMIEQKMAGETGVASMLRPAASGDSVARSRPPCWAPSRPPSRSNDQETEEEVARVQHLVAGSRDEC